MNFGYYFHLSFAPLLLSRGPAMPSPTWPPGKGNRSGKFGFSGFGIQTTVPTDNTTPRLWIAVLSSFIRCKRRSSQLSFSFWQYDEHANYPDGVSCEFGRHWHVLWGVTVPHNDIEWSHPLLEVPPTQSRLHKLLYGAMQFKQIYVTSLVTPVTSPSLTRYRA